MADSADGAACQSESRRRFEPQGVMRVRAAACMRRAAHHERLETHLWQAQQRGDDAEERQQADEARGGDRGGAGEEAQEAADGGGEGHRRGGGCEQRGLAVVGAGLAQQGPLPRDGHRAHQARGGPRRRLVAVVAVGRGRRPVADEDGEQLRGAEERQRARVAEAPLAQLPAELLPQPRAQRAPHLWRTWMGERPHLWYVYGRTRRNMARHGGGLGGLWPRDHGASRWNLSCGTSPRECGGQPQAFRRRL